MRTLTALVLAGALCGIAGECAGQAAEAIQQMEPVQVRKFFFSQFTTGTLAFVPDARSGTDAQVEARLSVFKTNGTYKLPRQKRPYYFRINHRLDGGGGPTFLSVLIAKVWSPTAEAGTLTWVVRNGRWGRPNDPDYSKTDATGSFQMNYDAFLSLHQPDDGLKSLDKIYKWHGIPAGANVHSWSHRAFWFGALSAVRALATNDAVKIDVAGRLMRFEPTSSAAPASEPPVFYFSPDDKLRRVHIRTFSPASQDFTHSYDVVFDK